MWDKADQKRAVIEELEDQGIFLNELAKEVGRDLDPFDLICHLAYGQKPLTRRERANNVKKRNYFAKYEGKARRVLELLLDKYADEGIEHIEDIEVLQVQPFNQMGTPVEIINDYFGSRDAYVSAVSKLGHYIYATA